MFKAPSKPSLILYSVAALLLWGAVQIASRKPDPYVFLTPAHPADFEPCLDAPKQAAADGLNCAD